MDTIDKTQIEAQETIIELDPSQTAEHGSASELDDSQLEEAAGGSSFGITLNPRTYCPKCMIVMLLRSKKGHTWIYKCPKCQQVYSINR